MNNNNNIIQIILPTLITVFGTYFFTRLLTSKSNHIDISKIQLNNIYAPLSKMIKYKYTNKLTISEINEFYNELHKVIFDNYQYVPKKLFDHEDKLSHCILNNPDEAVLNEYINEIKNHIEISYQLLKQTLNLPNDKKIKSYWVLLTPSEKISFIMDKFVIPIFFFVVIFMFIFNFADMICLIIFSLHIYDEIASLKFFGILIFFISVLLTLKLYEKK